MKFREVEQKLSEKVITHLIWLVFTMMSMKFMTEKEVL